jgi:hypothetical protein
MKSLPYKLPLICVAFFLLLSVGVHAVEIDFNTVIGDNVVNQFRSNWNYGAASAFSVASYEDIYGTLANQRAFVMFNLSSIPANSSISSARLYLYNYHTDGPLGGEPFIEAYNTSPYNTTGSVYWNEGSLFAVCGSGANCNLDHNMTWLNQPNTTGSVLQDNISVPVNVGGWYSWNITNALLNSYNKGLPISILLKDSMENETPNPRSQQFYSSESASANNPYIKITFTTSNNCNTSIIGTYCDVYDPTHRGIITTIDYTCENDKYYLCPENSLCTQITPQVNITTPLIENFTDCSKCSYVFTSNIWGLNPVLLWTNCPNNPECNPGPNSVCLSGTNPIIFTCPGVFITPTDTVPASAYEYTAGCFDPALGWVPIVIDQNGNQTTINNLTITIFGNNTNLTSPVMNSCPNSTSSCYIVNNSVCVPVTCTPSSGAAPSDSINSAAGGLAGLFGSLFGIADVSVSLAVFSLFISIGVGIVLMYYTRNSAQGGNTFIFGTLAPLIMFAVMGWFPGWILILLLVAGAFLVAKSMGLGGG